MSLTELFNKLKENPSGHVYTAMPLENRDNVYLGVDISGHPCLLLKGATKSIDPSLRTSKISLKPGQELNVAVDGNTPEKYIFDILLCESPDKSEVESFLILVDGFLSFHSGQELTRDSLVSFFRSLIKLFSIVAVRDLEAERQGLWGELFMMKCVKGFRFWAPHWHSESNRLFDFSAVGKRVEVKTTTNAQRIHQFSHRQIFALDGEEIMIASLLLREDDVGLGLQELIVECRNALRETQYYMILERSVRLSGMEDISTSGPRFDAKEAMRSLHWIRSTDAPHFRMAEPQGVTETRYKVDLSTATSINQIELDNFLNSWT